MKVLSKYLALVIAITAGIALGTRLMGIAVSATSTVCLFGAAAAAVYPFYRLSRMKGDSANEHRIFEKGMRSAAWMVSFWSSGVVATFVEITAPLGIPATRMAVCAILIDLVFAVLCAGLTRLLISRELRFGRTFGLLFVAGSAISLSFLLSLLTATLAAAGGIAFALAVAAMTTEPTASERARWNELDEQERQRAIAWDVHALESEIKYLREKLKEDEARLDALQNGHPKPAVGHPAPT